MDVDLQKALSEAIDEIYTLRALCAHMVETVDLMLEQKSLAGFRQNQLADDRGMLLIPAAQGDYTTVRTRFNEKGALKTLGVTDILTNHQWLSQRGHGE